MTADHLDQMEEIERLCFSDPWSRRLLSELLENEAAAKKSLEPGVPDLPLGAARRARRLGGGLTGDWGR